MYDIAIIGAGPNGLSLAKYAQESGLSCIVLEKESEICYNIKRLPNNFIFASKGSNDLGLFDANFKNRIDAQYMFEYYSSFVKKHNIKVLKNCIIFNYLKKNKLHKLETSIGEIEAKNIVLACGILQNPVDFPQDSLNISKRYLDYDDDKGKIILVIGMGNSAAVTVINKSKNNDIIWLVKDKFSTKHIFHLWKNNLNKVIKKSNVKIFDFCKILEIKNNICYTNYKNFNFDKSYALIGYKPNELFLKKFNILLKEDYPVHDLISCKTSIPGIYVCGTLANKANINGVFKRVFLSDSNHLSKQIIYDILKK